MLNKAKAHAAAADLAAKIASESKRTDQWQRERDKPERRAKSDTARALICYVRALGCGPDLEPILLRVMAATHGEDCLTICPNWLMGLYLGKGADEDPDEVVAVIQTLPAHHPDKRKLAARWTRAYESVQMAEWRSGVALIRYRPGDLDGETKRGLRASELHALFVQDLVEIERIAKDLDGDPLDRMQRAADLYVARLREDESRRPRHRLLACSLCQRTVSTREGWLPDQDCRASIKGVECQGKMEIVREARPNRIKAEPTPALACVKFLEKLEKLTGQLLDEIPDEMRAEMFEHAKALLRQKLLGEVDDPSNDQGPSPVCTLTNTGTHEFDEKGENLSKNGDSPHTLVHKFVYQPPVPRGSHICPAPDVDPVEIEERAAQIIEARGIADSDVEGRVRAAEQARRDLCEACHPATGTQVCVPTEIAELEKAQQNRHPSEMLVHKFVYQPPELASDNDSPAQSPPEEPAHSAERSPLDLGAQSSETQSFATPSPPSRVPPIHHWRDPLPEMVDDEARIHAAWDLMQRGQMEAALSIVSQIEDPLTRKAAHVRLQRAGAGERPARE